MYHAFVMQFAKTLKNLDAICDKATRHAEAKKFDVNNFLNLRLTPDMFTFTRQIQIACDVAKAAAAGLAGKDAPRFEDNETTMNDLRERIRKTHAYLESFRPEDFAKTNSKSTIKVAYPAGKAMLADDALVTRAVPNFFFHVSMAYALLRAGGVDVGKVDYLGDLKMFDA